MFNKDENTDPKLSLEAIMKRIAIAVLGLAVFTMATTHVYAQSGTRGGGGGGSTASSGAQIS